MKILTETKSLYRLAPFVSIRLERLELERIFSYRFFFLGFRFFVCIFKTREEYGFF
jgi:hypothetical protein